MRTFAVSWPLLATVLLLALGAAAASAAEDPPAIRWQRLYGGTGWDEANAVLQTADGGYAFLGASRSSQSGDVTPTNHGGAYVGDVWLVRTDAVGAVLWQRLLGGTKDDGGYSLAQAADGGFLLLGSSNSDRTGDVSGANGGSGFNDLWVVKVNATGALQWQRLFGGAAIDNGRAVQPTVDGGCILVGESVSSRSGDVTATNNGDVDVLVVKLNATGGVQWHRLLGGSSTDRGASVQQTPDGGYAVLGTSSSSQRGDVTGASHGQADFWLVKLDAAGAIQWQRLYGGTGDDTGYALRRTADGGYVLFGESTSPASGDITGPARGLTDWWVVKTDAVGGVQWQRRYGGAGDDFARAARQTTDGGYILLGHSGSSTSGDVTDIRHGGSGYDLWVVQLNATGGIRWQRLLGGTAIEYAAAVQQTVDGGFVLTGSSGSSASGDVAGTSHGSADAWLVSLAASTSPVLAVPPGTAQPTDTNGDGLYDDVNGNGRMDFADVVLYFNSMTWIAANEPIAAFDCNRNGRIDFADVVWLFNHL